MTLVRKNEGTFLFGILLEMCVQSLKSVIPVVLVPELVKCLPVKNLSPPKFLQPWKLQHKILFKHIFESNYHLSNFLWNLYIITANKSLKQIPVGFPFNFIFLLQYNKQEIINQRRHEIHSARRFIEELKTWLRQMQPPDLFYKKVVLENFATFTGKHLCYSLFK